MTSKSLPEKIPYGRYIFVRPDQTFKFPVFLCCNGHHSGENRNNNNQYSQPLNQSNNFGDNPTTQRLSNSTQMAAAIGFSPTNDYSPSFPSGQDDFPYFPDPVNVVAFSPPKTTRQITASSSNYQNSKGTDFLADHVPIIDVDRDTARHNKTTSDEVLVDLVQLQQQPRRRESAPLLQTNNNFFTSSAQKKQQPTTDEASSREEIIEIVQPKVEKRGTQQHDQDHEAMDDFILDEPLTANKLTFLRPNLVFDVVPKTAANFKKVMDNLRAIHANGSGLIFCMSKVECDGVAETLGPTAQPYHTDLADSVRQNIQRHWTQGQLQILCATSAFGKGVDKPDVRFIVHHTLPQSMQQYEQQCAMAGLDGKVSHCVLMYNFQDHLRVLRLIVEDVPRPPANVVQQKTEALHNMLHYCENVVQCRRSVLAHYFGEKYSEERCIITGNPCTICDPDGTHRLQTYNLYDFTEEAFAVFRSTGSLQGSGINFVADLFRGQMTKKKVKQAVDDSNYGRLPLFGLGQGMSEVDCQRFLHKLVIENFLSLRLVTTRHNTVVGYVRLSKRGAEFLGRYKAPENVPPEERICMHICEHREKRRSSKSLEELAASTSQVLALANKRPRKF